MLKRELTLGVMLIALGASAAENRPPIGTNINGLSYGNTGLPLLDAFKTSSPWISGTKDEWNDGRMPAYPQQ